MNMNIFVGNCVVSLVVRVCCDPCCVGRQQQHDDPPCGHSPSACLGDVVLLAVASVHADLSLATAEGATDLSFPQNFQYISYLGLFSFSSHVHADPPGEQVPLGDDGVEAGASAPHAGVLGEVLLVPRHRGQGGVHSQLDVDKVPLDASPVKGHALMFEIKKSNKYFESLKIC